MSAYIKNDSNLLDAYNLYRLLSVNSLLSFNLLN